MEDLIREFEHNKGHYDIDSTNTINNLIKYNLYKKGMDELIAWFLGTFGFYDAFRNLFTKSDFLQSLKEEYSNFDVDSEILDFAVNETSFNKSLEICFANEFENLSV